jgi:large subunit ribosomal protein L3
MIRGMIGRKIGMGQMFDGNGHAVGVTVVEAGPCTVIGKKGDSRVQLGFEPTKESRVSKPIMGQFKKAGVGPFKVLKEFEVEEIGAVEVGQEVRADIFSPGEKVKVVSTSKGKGFAGVMKRWHFGGGKDTHGSRSHRIPGSVGQCAYPGRVFKGKKLPGRMGGVRVTAPRVEVFEVRAEQNLILLKGPVPGSRGAIVFIRKS